MQSDAVALASSAWIESNPISHEAKLLKSNLESHTHLRRSDTNMGLRDSFSKLKKKLKHPLTGKKRKSDKTGADAGGERVDSASSLSRLEPPVVAGGSHAREDNGAKTDEQQVGSTDQPPQLDESVSVPARGSEGDQEGGDVNFDRTEASQVHPHPHSEVEVGAGSGPSGEGDGIHGEKVEQVDPSPFAPPPSHDEESDGMRIPLFRSLPLIVPSDDVWTPIIPDHEILEFLYLDESEPSTAMGGNKSDWKSSVSATTELLRGVKDGPLKSAATRLRFILENCEVWSSSYTSDLHRLRSS